MEMLIGDLNLERMNKMFNIEMLPAGHGDCIYIEYGDSKNPFRVLIDAGPYYGFKDLAKRIDGLSNLSLDFELFVITHIDCDHVDGAIKLLGAKPSGLNIKDVWFNAYEHLFEEKDKMGAKHGEMLSALIETFQLPWNNAPEFNGGSICITIPKSLPEVLLDGKLKLTILSPNMKELAELESSWKKDVLKAGLEPGSREEALKLLKKNARLKPPKDLLGAPKIKSSAKKKFHQDTSEANATSIAFLAEYENKKYIFAGDAHPDVLVDSIKTLLHSRGESKLALDAFKVSHHGSKGNTNVELLELLDCKQFLFSTNGNYFKHPDEEAIARIIINSGPDVHLFFNYYSDTTKVWKDSTLQKKFEYQTHYPKKKEKGLTIPME